MINLSFLIFDFFSLGTFLPMPPNIQKFIFGAVIVPIVLAYVVKKITYMRYPYGSVSLFLYFYALLVVSHYNYPSYFYISYIIIYFVSYVIFPIHEYRVMLFDLKKAVVKLAWVPIYYKDYEPYYASQGIFDDLKRLLFSDDISLDTGDVPILTSMLYNGQPLLVASSMRIEKVPKENPSFIDKIFSPNLKKFVLVPAYAHKYSPYDFFEKSKIFEIINEEVSNLSEEYHLLEAEKNIHINRQVGDRVKYFVDKLAEVMFLGQKPQPANLLTSPVDKKLPVVEGQSNESEGEAKNESGKDKSDESSK